MKSFSLVELLDEIPEADAERLHSNRRRKLSKKNSSFDAAHCVSCDAPAWRALSERSACVCGSVCWYVGARPVPIWRAVTVPMFIALSTEELTGLINRKDK